jgi:hypothetical protein
MSLQRLCFHNAPVPTTLTSPHNTNVT